MTNDFSGELADGPATRYTTTRLAPSVRNAWLPVLGDVVPPAPVSGRETVCSGKPLAIRSASLTNRCPSGWPVAWTCLYGRNLRTSARNMNIVCAPGCLPLPPPEPETPKVPAAATPLPTLFNRRHC